MSIVPTIILPTDILPTISETLEQVEKTHGVRVLLAVESGSRAWGIDAECVNRLLWTELGLDPDQG